MLLCLCRSWMRGEWRTSRTDDERADFSLTEDDDDDTPTPRVTPGGARMPAVIAPRPAVRPALLLVDALRPHDL